MIYDYILIGGGAAGIYCAYSIKKRFPQSDMLILEATDCPGGRTKKYDINNISISSGAYGARYSKDKRLIKLLKEFNEKLDPQKSNRDFSYLDKKIDIESLVKYCVSSLDDENKVYNTKYYISSLLSPNDYNTFVENNGRSDFELENIIDTLSHYGLDDNLPGNYFVGVDWNNLWIKILQSFGDSIIKYNTLVTDISIGDKIIISTGNDVNYYCKKLIICTEISTVKRLLPAFDIYNDIGEQPFIRIYAAFNEKGTNILKKYINTYTLVKQPLQSIIPIQDNIYMIAYADGLNAQSLTKINNYSSFEQLVESSLQCESLKDTILSIKSFYHNPGTHYYRKYSDDRKKFIRKAQNPCLNIYVCGECVSLNQGWVEGALESVDNIINDI